MCTLTLAGNALAESWCVCVCVTREIRAKLYTSLFGFRASSADARVYHEMKTLVHGNYWSFVVLRSRILETLQNYIINNLNHR